MDYSMLHLCYSLWLWRDYVRGAYSLPGGDSSKGTCQHPMEWHYASEVGEKGLGPALGCKGHLEVES